MNSSVGLLVLLSGALAGCGATSGAEATGGQPAPSRGVAVGAVESTDVKIAVASNDQHVVVYACGGPTSIQEWTHWYGGALSSPEAFEVMADAWSVEGQRDASGWKGNVKAPTGITYAWSAASAPAGTIAGLYGVVDGGCRTGVIVEQSSPSASPGVQGAWCDGKGQFEQVTPILPVALTAQGIEVVVNLSQGQGVKHLFAGPVSAP
jgi:hypothetical protein